MKTTVDFLAEFLLDKLAVEPVGRRIPLYRALAAETKDEALATACDALADDLELIETRHRQLVLDFQRRNEG